MADFAIVAEPRTVSGKKVKNLRKQGIVPAVMYGKGEPATSVQLNERELRSVFRRGGNSAQIDLVLEGETRMVVVQDMQRHITRGDILHVDFLEISATDVITSDAFFVLVGEAPVLVANPGRIAFVMREFEFESVASAMISEIEVDISLLKEVNDAIYVRDVNVPEGVKIMLEPDTMIARFEAQRIEEVAEVEEVEGEEGAAEAGDEEAAE